MDDDIESQHLRSPSERPSIRARHNSQRSTVVSADTTVPDHPFVPKPLEPLSEEGYARLAWLMAKTDSSYLAIFRKFGELNMFNLLLLQSELMELHETFRLAYGTESAKYRYSLKEIRESEGSSVPNETGVAYPQGPDVLAVLEASNPLVNHNKKANEDDGYNSEDGSQNFFHLLSKRIQKKLREYSKRVYHDTQRQLTHETRRSALASLPARRYGHPALGKSRILATLALPTQRKSKR